MKIKPISFNNYQIKQAQPLKSNKVSQNKTQSSRGFFSFGSYEPIDVKNWNRKEIYGLYSQAVQPYYSASVKTDVTNLIKTAKEKGINRSYAIYYMLSKTANEIDAFKQRDVDGIPVQFDEVDLSGTVAKSGGIFNYQDFEHSDNPKEFIENIDKRMKEAQARDSLFPNQRTIDKEEESYIYVSCAPTMDFESFNNPFVLPQQNDSIPRILWGKPVNKDGKTQMAISIEANHKFIDGYHLSQFMKKFEQHCKNADKIFANIPNKN